MSENNSSRKYLGSTGPELEKARNKDLRRIEKKRLKAYLNGQENFIISKTKTHQLIGKTELPANFINPNPPTDPNNPTQPLAE